MATATAGWDEMFFFRFLPLSDLFLLPRFDAGWKIDLVTSYSAMPVGGCIQCPRDPFRPIQDTAINHVMLSHESCDEKIFFFTLGK